MAKKFNIEDTQLYKDVHEYADNGVWPFKSITPEKFLEESERLLKLHHYRESRKLANTKIAADAYMDMTTGASFRMLKCVQDLECEAAEKELFQMDKFESGHTFDVFFLEAQEFATKALDTLYQCNNDICDALFDDLKKQGIYPRYIDMEKERTYYINEECEFAKKATAQHYDAVEDAYKNINDLIKYGLPSDAFLMKIKDSITGAGKIKLNNKVIVDNLLNSEADLEVVEKYILPEIKKGIKVFKHKARYEEKHSRDQLQEGQIQVGDPYYFRNGYRIYQEAYQVIKTALSQMREKEASLKSAYVIAISKDPNDDTYTLTAKWTSGKKSTKKNQKKVTQNISKTSKTTKEKNYKEKSFTVTIGQSSRRLYEETRKRAACKLGYENVQALEGEKRSIANKFVASIFRSELRRQRKNKLDGKKESSQSFQVDVLKVSDDVTYKKKREDQPDFEYKLLGAGINVGSAGASIKTNNGIPTAQANLNVAGASAEALEIAKISGGLGGASYSTAVDIPGKIKEVGFEKLLGDETPIGETAKEYLSSTLNKLHSISLSKPKFSGKFTIKGLTIDSISYDGTTKTTHRLPDIIDRVDKAHDQVSDWLDQTEAESDPIYEEPMGMDADVLDEEPINTEIFDIADNDLGLNVQEMEQKHNDEITPTR